MPTRYYNAEDERLQKIKSKYSDSNETEEYIPNANFRKEWSNKNTRKASSNKQSNIRLIVIIGVLFFAAWYLLIRNNALLL